MCSKRLRVLVQRVIYFCYCHLPLSQVHTVLSADVQLSAVRRCRGHLLQGAVHQNHCILGVWKRCQIRLRYLEPSWVQCFPQLQVKKLLQTLDKWWKRGVTQTLGCKSEDTVFFIIALENHLALQVGTTVECHWVRREGSRIFDLCKLLRITASYAIHLLNKNVYKTKETP